MYTYKVNQNGIIYDITFPDVSKKTLIILLPGLPEYPLPKQLMLDLANAGYFVIYPRYRGTFESDGEFLSRSPAYDILELLTFLEKTKKITELYSPSEKLIEFSKVVVLGPSFGGSVALHLSQLTEKISKYLVFAPVLDFKSHGNIQSEQDLKNLLRFLEQGYKNVYRFKKENFYKLLKGEILPSAFDNKIDSSKIVLIHGNKDPSVSFQNSKKFAELSGCKFVEVEGGHLSFSKIPISLILSLLEK